MGHTLSAAGVLIPCMGLQAEAAHLQWTMIDGTPTGISSYLAVHYPW